MDLITALRELPYFFLISAGLLGLMVGSFLNVVILRLPVMLEAQWRRDCEEFLNPDQPPPDSEPFNLVRPRSHCPKCGHQISALENIPVISYVFLGGKCSACATRIPLRYPIIEAVTAAAYVILASHFGVEWKTLAAMVLAAALIALTVIDFDRQLLPDAVTFPILWIGLLLSTGNMFVDSSTAIIGAIAGYLSLWLTFQGFKLLTGKEGMGYGDFKLLALLGAWLGWQMLPLVILVSSLVGACIGILLILFRGHDRSVPIPFGPYLAIAGFIALIWGPNILTTYLAVAGIR